MSKAKKTEGTSPEALGAAFACEQANVNGKLLKTLKETIGVYTVEKRI